MRRPTRESGTELEAGKDDFLNRDDADAKQRDTQGVGVKNRPRPQKCQTEQDEIGWYASHAVLIRRVRQRCRALRNGHQRQLKQNDQEKSWCGEYGSMYSYFRSGNQDDVHPVWAVCADDDCLLNIGGPGGSGHKKSRAWRLADFGSH